MSSFNHNGTGPDVGEALRSALQGRGDTNFSEGDPAEFAATYREGMDAYRQHGVEFLASGDYRQAAEKSWGAFAQSVKAVAADYGVRLAHHGVIIRASGALAELAAEDAPDDGDLLRQGLAYARSLHQHFYENDLLDDDVIHSSGVVAASIDLMQQRFASY